MNSAFPDCCATRACSPVSSAAHPPPPLITHSLPTTLHPPPFLLWLFPDRRMFSVRPARTKHSNAQAGSKRRKTGQNIIPNSVSFNAPLFSTTGVISAFTQWPVPSKPVSLVSQCVTSQISRRRLCAVRKVRKARRKHLIHTDTRDTRTARTYRSKMFRERAREDLKI